VSSKLYEVRFHGRGGQGVVTAAEVLALAASYEGLYATASPFYGAERRGAPVVAYARISERPIRVTGPITRPDAVVVAEISLLEQALIGLKERGVVVVNSSEEVRLDKYRVYAVDATSIAIRSGLVKSGWALVNIPLLGVFSSSTGLISLESLIRAIRDYFHGDVAERNIMAVELAYRTSRALLESHA